jgi:hypothetical protein
MASGSFKTGLDVAGPALPEPAANDVWPHLLLVQSASAGWAAVTAAAAAGLLAQLNAPFPAAIPAICFFCCKIGFNKGLPT